MSELYVSTDIETDGPIPGPHSMLSIGSAVFVPDGRMISTFSANLFPLEGAQADPGTAQWWKSQPEAWAAVTKDRRDPSDVMYAYFDWLQSLKGKPVFVAYPAGFDFTFVYWYLMRFVGESPFSWSALDVKTFAMAKLGTPYRGSIKKAWPRAWSTRSPHTHVALDDAIEQGEQFIKMLHWSAP